ncbi:MAG: hypothetical protein RhofKO_11610 [Rhodothermales bacterium]
MAHPAASWGTPPHSPASFTPPQRYIVPSPKTQQRDKAQTSKLAVLLSFFVFWLIASGLFLALYLDRYLF